MLDTKERREYLLQCLSATPITASALAQSCGVSRQVIVGDIALLRAAGHSIAATPRGYLSESLSAPAANYRALACRHGPEQLRDELYAIIDNGALLLDVTVEHPVYGPIQCDLRLSSRYDCDCFAEKLEAESAMPLSGLTGGLHYHNILCPDENCYRRVIAALNKLNVLVDG